MAKDEPLYQKGICRNCSEEIPQRYLFAENDPVGINRDERGRLDFYAHVQTFSLFRCDGCKAILFYKTAREDVVDVEWLDEMSPEWVTELDEDEFKKNSERLYPQPARTCSEFVPQLVKECYQVALEVKGRNANLFAVQLRKTLEAICHERGARRDNLVKMLEELSTKGILPPTLAEIAREIRDTGNKGAHDDSGVSHETAQALDDNFHIIINYLYDAPAKLNAFGKLLPELIQASDDTVH